MKNIKLIQCSIFIACIVLAIAITSCNFGTKKTEEKTDTVKVKKDTVKTAEKIEINQKYNDIAKILGGIAVDEKSEYFEITGYPQWKNYSVRADTNWAKYYRKTLDKIPVWSEKEIPDVKTKTLFYPFSGPDFLHMISFFPNADKYIMFGLEPAGSIPDPKKVKKDSLTSYFNLLNRAIEDAVSLSFFKTIDMTKELNNNKVDGTIPILMLFMARTKTNIIDIKPVDIDAAGDVKELKEFKHLPGKERFNTGTEITFVRQGKTKKQVVYFFSADISDGGLAKDANCTKFFEKLDTGVTTYVKSASYLMHKSYFSVIRNTVLNKSRTVLQDDSGISYKFFDKTKWKIQLYGNYVKPINLFENMLEEDLRDAYAKESKPLNIKVGYGKRSSMLLARKVGKF